MLIGAEIFWQILCTGQIRLAKDKLVLQKTLFGWRLGGVISSNCNPEKLAFLATKDKLHAQIEKFWNLEEAAENRKLTEEEQLCEDYFVKTVKRNEEGRFIVSLPRKQPFKLRYSYDSTLK